MFKRSLDILIDGLPLGIAGLLCPLVVAGLLILVLVFWLQSYLGILAFIGVVQLLYVVPLCQSQWRAGQLAFSMGVATGAFLVFAANIIALLTLLMNAVAYR